MRATILLTSAVIDELSPDEDFVREVIFGVAECVLMESEDIVGHLRYVIEGMDECKIVEWFLKDPVERNEYCRGCTVRDGAGALELMYEGALAHACELSIGVLDLIGERTPCTLIDNMVV
jgi:hypothetical protein